MVARIPGPDWSHVGWHYKLIHRTVSPWHNPVLARSRGVEHAPRSGAFLYAANHTSWWDPIFLQASIGRPVNWLAKKEIMQNPFTKWFFGKGGCIRVDRDSRNPDAFRDALRALADGRIIGIFPEGTRNHGELKEPKSGVGRLALASGCPVVPAAVLTDRFWPRHRKVPDFGQPVYIHVGEPVYFKGDAEDRDEAQAVSREVMARIGDLMEEARGARDRGDDWAATG